MEILLIVTILLLIGTALLLVLYPLWQQTRPEAVFQQNHAGLQFEEYQLRYQAVLASIKDLMFDYEMGKVSTDDYETLLAKAKLEAAQIRQQMDRFEADASAPAPVNSRLDAQIEALIAQARNGGSAPTASLLKEIDAEIELLKSATGLTCADCGAALHPGDAFCSRCGRPVTAPQPEPAAAACPQCGYAFRPGDAFCVKCGATLPQAHTVENILR